MDAVMGDRAEDTPADSGVIVGQAAGSDVAAGKAAFGIYCAACHSVTTGGTGIGPSLGGVVGRKAGTSPGYAYSPAMSNSEVIWTPENIAKHLEKPKELIPENRMGNLFPRGVQDAKQRGDIVAYLQTVR
jgi:cytochrome c